MGKPEPLERFIAENYSEEVLARGTARQRSAGGMRLYRDNGGAPKLSRIERSLDDDPIAFDHGGGFPGINSQLDIYSSLATTSP